MQPLRPESSASVLWSPKRLPDNQVQAAGFRCPVQSSILCAASQLLLFLVSHMQLDSVSKGPLHCRIRGVCKPCCCRGEAVFRAGVGPKPVGIGKLSVKRLVKALEVMKDPQARSQCTSCSHSAACGPTPSSTASAAQP